MFISNVRIGFGTLSSSQHSIVIVPSETKDENTNGDYFGWDGFLATSKRQKERYLYATLFANLRAQIGKNYALHIMNSLLGKCNFKSTRDIPCIDHQSLIFLPRKYGNIKEIDFDFYNDLSDYILKKDVAILGKNDNTDYRTSYTKHKISHIDSKMIKDAEENFPLICRKDGHFWTLFNRKNGIKIRFSFDLTAPPKASSTPELVDLKITDRCNWNCDFCYEDSSPTGRHACTEVVEGILRSLSKFKVFEVALGGGDPVVHPHFAHFLRNYPDHPDYAYAVTFSSRSLNWMREGDLEEKVVRFVRGIGISVPLDVSERILEQIGLWKIKQNYKGRISLLVIPEFWKNPTETVINFINKISKIGLYDLTFLGAKCYGRGKHLHIHRLHLNEVIDCIRQNMFLLSVDTTFVQRYINELLETDISQILFSTVEGAFSCAIDAVTQTIAADSFSKEGKTFFKSITDFIDTMNKVYPFKDASEDEIKLLDKSTTNSYWHYWCL